MTHLWDRHGIRRNSPAFYDYLNQYFNLPTCACGCGRATELRRKGLVLNLFARDCPHKNRFVNPKFPEFYLFAGQTPEQAIESVRAHQAKLASRAATIAHRERLSRLNSGAANPASLSSVVARTGLDPEAVRQGLRERSRGSNNGFHGRQHTPETRRHLARVRAAQAKPSPALS